MSVNLTKPFQGREYTPVHLMDEEDSIQRSSLTASSEKLPSYTPEHIAYEPPAPNQAADIDVAVVHAENAPAVVAKPDLNICMTELLEGIENADADTREKFMNEFLKAAKKKKRSMKRHEFAPSKDIVHIFLIGLGFAAFATLGNFLPTIIESLTNESEVGIELYSTLIEIANHLRPVAFLVGSFGTLTTYFYLFRKILFPFN